jgi:hypothetical protein
MTFFVLVRWPDPKGITPPSYNDFWRMVMLSGFATCEVSEIDPQSNNTYIVPFNYMGWLLPPEKFTTDRKAKYILWQLERTNLIDEAYDEIWLSYYGIPELQHPKAKYVPFGGHKDFVVPIEGLEKEYDFYHMCYLPGRRYAMVENLASQGYKIAPCPEDFESKNRLLQQSKYGLCLHQDELKYIEPIRYTVFSLYKLLLIAEDSSSFYPYLAIPFDCWHNLVLHPYTQTFIEKNYELFTEYFSFTNCVNNALR